MRPWRPAALLVVLALCVGSAGAAVGRRSGPEVSDELLARRMILVHLLAAWLETPITIRDWRHESGALRIDGHIPTLTRRHEPFDPLPSLRALEEEVRRAMPPGAVRLHHRPLAAGHAHVIFTIIVEFARER